MTDQTQPKPLSVPLARAHEVVGGISRTQFAKVYVHSGEVEPVDLGARGLSVFVDELEAAVRRRAEKIRSGELVPPIRSSRGKKRALVTAVRHGAAAT